MPMQTPGPAPALAPLPGEEKEKITAMPVAGKSSSVAVGVSASETAAGVAELSGAASGAGGGGELDLCHVASARSFAVRGALPDGGDSVDGDGGTSGAVASINHPFIVLTETKFSFRCIPVWIGTLL